MIIIFLVIAASSLTAITLDSTGFDVNKNPYYSTQATEKIKDLQDKGK